MSRVFPGGVGRRDGLHALSADAAESIARAGARG
jgi:hypothetical protein